MVTYLLHLPGHDAIRTRFHERGADLHAPHLVDVEVTHVLRRYAAQRTVPETTAQTIIDLLGRFPIRRHPHTPLLKRAWALRANFSAYDAVYVALAEALDAVLLTQDVAMGAAASRLIEVDVITTLTPARTT